MKHRIHNALFDYDWWLQTIKADNYLFVPVGIAATVLTAFYGLWLALQCFVQSRDLQCLALVLFLSYFARPLWRRNR